ncbi:MAG: heme lyase CcmF/NrfE family subunit [Thermoleophilaceae bacterium]
MATIGTACLVVALLTAVYAIGAALYGARSGRREFVASSRHAFYCIAGLAIAATALIESRYLASDFSFSLVAQNSSTDLPTFYKLTALWSSQAGSLLFWVLVLSIFSSIVLRVTRRSHREIVPYATAVLGGIAGFFLVLMLAYASPFDTLSNPPAEGNGLEPLLRHPAMMFHPPMLYAGYVGFAIPFAFAIGALVTRRTGADWIRSSRRFALIAWTFLGTGVLLGALWSYSELGWGGYWAWDPVENAALMPWLTGTAFLHSIMVQEKRGMLRVWNMVLIIATFVLSLLGTFLVRSGVLDSIHAFGASTLGVPFLTFIAVVLVGSVALLLTRLDDLKSRARIDSLLSRESFFLLNNLVLVGLCFVIFWGTWFPLISEAVTGSKASVGPPWFDRYTMPLALLLVALAGIGPLLAWRRITPSAAARAFRVPLAATAATLVLLLAFTNAADSISSLILFCLVAFVLTAVGQEFWRGAAARHVMTKEPRLLALSRLVGRNRRRYGGYIVHAGFALVLIGVAGSSAFAKHQDVRLAAGQTTKVGSYEISYLRPTAGVVSDRAGTGAPITLGAVLRVKHGDKTFIAHPSRNYYPSQDLAQGGTFGRFFEGEANSEIAMTWGLSRNFWAAVTPDISPLMKPIAEANRRFSKSSPDEQGLILAAITESYANKAPPATFRMIVSPMVSWIWIGGTVAILGALMAGWPSPEARRRRVTSLYAARLGRDLSRA